MPVNSDMVLINQGQEAFHEIDRIVMRHAFELHNTIGRFLDEEVYQAEMTDLLRNAGRQVRREVRLQVMHGAFHKDFFLDLVIDGFAICEFKTAENLNATHESQLIHYLLLANLNHGKLVNFRTPSVQSRFVSTSLTEHERKNYVFDDSAWVSSGQTDLTLRQVLFELLADWGAGLEISLYRAALLALVPAPEGGLLPVDIVINGTCRGSKPLCLLDAGTAWHISSLPKPTKPYQTHLTRLLQQTRLQTLHWINLHHSTITLKTIKK